LTHTRELAVIVGATFRPLFSGVPRRPFELQKALLRFCRDRWRSPGLLLVPVLAVLGIAECELVLPLAARLLLWGDHPPLARFLQEMPPTIGRIEDGRGVLLVELARQHRQPFEAHELPPVLVDALLSAEDRSFFEHRGVDPAALPRVALKVAVASLRAGRLVMPQGGSTITQQLVRAVLLRGLRSREAGSQLLYDSLVDRTVARAFGVPAANKLRRKAEEIRLSYWLEAELERSLGSRAQAKLEILRRYATYVYLGQGRYGFAAASELYLGRPLASLCHADAAAAALLAGLPKNPGEYAPIERNSARVRGRRDHVLRLMARNGFITEAERAQFAAEPVRLVAPQRPPQPPIGTASAVGALFEELGALGDPRVGMGALYDGRLVVRTSVVKEVQAILTQALEGGLRAYEARHPRSVGLVQGSAVVLANGDGRVLALCGGRQRYGERAAGYRDFNRVTESRRQPGSAMKPFVYLAAFRQGATLATRVLDEPIAVQMGEGRAAKWIVNYDGEFLGSITLRRALAESRNAATVRLLTQVGIPAVLGVARELGIRSRLQPVPATALGGSEVTLLELANAYRSLASGAWSEPWLLQQVTSTEGAPIYRHVSAVTHPLDPATLTLVQEALRGVVRLPGATAHALATLPIPVMGKTGTTNEFRDAIFVGSTYGPTGVTVAVRVGFDDNRSLGNGETGARVALPVFRETMLALYSRGLVGPVPRFPRELEKGIEDYLRGPQLTPPQELVAEAPALEPLAPLLVPPPLALRAELPLPAAMLAPTPQIRPATLASSTPAAER
jgi:penicillin-binding protein 1A